MIKVHLNIQKSTLQNHHYLSHKVQRILVSQLLTPSVNAYTEFKLCLIPIPCVIAWPGAFYRYLAIAAAGGVRPHMEGWPARHQPSSVRQQPFGMGTNVTVSSWWQIQESWEAQKAHWTAAEHSQWVEHKNPSNETKTHIPSTEKGARWLRFIH